MTDREALVLAGHGSRFGPGAAAPLFAHADRIRSRGAFSTVRTAFWAQEPALHDVRHTLDANDAYVVPVLTSEGYFADEVFPRELGLDRDRDGDGPRLHYTEPVGTHDAMTGVIEDRVRGAVDGPTADVTVAVVGHGTPRNEASARATEYHAERLRRRGWSAVARFLDATPAVADLTGDVEAETVVVVPIFVADGPHTTGDVPAAMGHPGVGAVATIDGVRVHYTGAVGTEPTLADVIVERAVEAGARGRRDASADAFDPAEAAFLEWVEAAGSGRTWGQLAVSSAGADYELRHVADRPRDRATLGPLAGLADLRRLARRDADGRYRPLTGATTLPRGWVLTTDDAAGLLAAVRGVYPGSIGLWARARADALEPTPFRAAAARQTGRYADLDAIDGRTIAATAEAVCGGCVRDRRWEIAPGEPIDDDGAEGAVPCREPCPFVRAAASAFDDAALDPSVAADPTVPPGAFDDPGNASRVAVARALDRRRRPEAPPASGGSR